MHPDPEMFRGTGTQRDGTRDPFSTGRRDAPVPLRPGIGTKRDPEPISVGTHRSHCVSKIFNNFGYLKNHHLIIPRNNIHIIRDT